MKAVVVKAFGPPETHLIGDIPDPVVGAGEVVVEIATSEANYPDLLFVEGKYQRKPALPAVPGMGGAGRVLEVGAGVTGFEAGQKVLVLPDQGTHAERVCIPEGHCIAVPEDVPFEAAAALGLAFQTAYFALMDHGRFHKGETVMVLGAKGGVGSAAVLLAKAFGAGCVIAVTRGEAGAAAARKHGADVVVDAADPALRDNLRVNVMDATDARGADVVIDPVGGLSTEAALRAMAWRGRLVVVGFAANEIPVFKGNYLLLKGLSVTGFQWTEHRVREIHRVRQAQAEMFELYRAGRLVPPISDVRPLDSFAEVMSELRAARIEGKVVFKVAS